MGVVVGPARPALCPCMPGVRLVVLAMARRCHPAPGAGTDHAFARVIGWVARRRSTRASPRCRDGGRGRAGCGVPPEGRSGEPPRPAGRRVGEPCRRRPTPAHVGRTVEPCRVRLGLEGEPSDPARPIEAQVLDPRQPAVTEEPSGDRVEVADVVVAQAAGGPGRPSLPLSTISSNRRSGNPSWAWKAGSRSSAMTALTDPRKRCSALEPQADFLASLKPFEGG
jgi:hypothetical protein